MAQNFLSCDREQELLLPPSLREWLPEDHLAWLVLDAVDAIDLGQFYGAYRDDGHGRAAHDPAMMVALLLYSYAIGERSSRVIERRCREDVARRVICANRTLDHATIARFRARHQDALARTLTQVLALCAKAGLVSVGLVALDGTVIAADASLAATGTHAAIREEIDRILGEAAEIDAAEDERFGHARGDELPAELADRRSRIERLRRCREELEAQQAAAQVAYEDNLRRRAEWEAEHGRKLGGRKPLVPDPAALAARKINTTDPDSRLIVRRGRTPVQGYNAQAVATAGQIILAADVTQQITALREHGIEAIVPTKATMRTAPRTLSARQGPEAERIDRLLDTPDGAALYRRRQQIIEPVFAHTKFLRRIDRFQRRGLAACKAEWQLIAASHNLLKLWRATTPAIA